MLTELYIEALLVDEEADGWERNPENKRDRFLVTESLGAYGRELDRESAGPRDALWLVVLTGQRQQSVLSMRRDQLFLEDQLWRVPASATKTNEVYRVPLSKWAVKIIKDRLAAIAPGEVWLFPKRRGDAGPAGLTYLAKPHKRTCERAGITDYRAHDHRHTFATHADAAGVPRLIWDGILGHADTSMAQLYSGFDFSTQRLDCMEKWAERIAAAMAKNVVQLERPA